MLQGTSQPPPSRGGRGIAPLEKLMPPPPLVVEILGKVSVRP